MSLRRSLCVAVVGLAFTFAVGMQAKAKDSRKTLLIPFDAAVAGSHLASGSYDVQWQTHSPEATVRFLRGSKIAATAEGKVVDRGSKYPANEVVYSHAADGARQIQELRFSGSSEVIVFNQ